MKKAPERGALIKAGSIAGRVQRCYRSMPPSIGMTVPVT
jgi:hypothetical protein